MGVLGVDGRIILKLMFHGYNVRVWTEFIWLKVLSSKGYLRMW